MTIPLIVIIWLVSGVLPSSDVLAEAPNALLERVAWDAIKNGKLDEASRLFTDAIARRPHDASLRLGAGLAEHLQGHPEKARTSLEEALRLNPALTPASVLLGEIFYRDGAVDHAIRVYEAALTFAPNEALLRNKLETWRKEAELHGNFQRRLNAHFTVLFEGPREQELADAALRVLESAYWRIGMALAAYPPSIITVILYTEEQFHDITRSPSWAGGAYDGKIRIPMRDALGNLPQLEKVLAHEFTHALVESLSPRRTPIWLNEGLAVVFENGELTWAEQIVRSAPAVLPLSRLHESFLQLPSDQVPLAYAESALAVRMLLERSGPLALSMLLKDLNAGQEFAFAFEHYYTWSYLEFQSVWHESLRRVASP
jgi:tetratricopeptide (TPR) repeat protein